MTENDVFRKIKELSIRARNPRATLNITDVAAELSMNHATLVPWLLRLHELKLVNYSKLTPTTIKLTLLGTVVTR